MGCKGSHGVCTPRIGACGRGAWWCGQRVLGRNSRTPVALTRLLNPALPRRREGLAAGIVCNVVLDARGQVRELLHVSSNAG